MKSLHPILPVLLACSIPPLAAHQAHETDSWRPTPYAEKAAHAPRPLPDRVVLTWAGDPATTQAVTWRTDTSVVRSLAEIAFANDNGRDLKPRSVPARTELFTSDLGEAAYHSVNFTGLLPATLYAYRVGDGANWSEWFHFRTASKETRPFTFVYFGDAQNDIKTHWSRVFRESFRDAQWGEWFGASPRRTTAITRSCARPGNRCSTNSRSTLSSPATTTPMPAAATSLATVGTTNAPAGYSQAYDPAIGTVYVVSVSGPKMYNVTNDHFAVRTAEDTQLYQIIQVGLDELRYEARTAAGRLYDAFTLKKHADRANELIETLPAERRRLEPKSGAKSTDG